MTQVRTGLAPWWRGLLLGVSAISAFALATSAWPGGAGAASGSGQRSPTCFGEPATIVGDGTDEDFVGTERADVIVAAGGNDSIHGLGGDDLLCGGAGRDQIDGGQGIVGGTGADRIHGGSGGDDLLGYGGRDLILGGSGDDDLNGGRGRDRLRGQKGNDTLTGENVPVHPNVRDGCLGGPGKDRLYFC